jgi:CheY-like chemotaxis protein
MYRPLENITVLVVDDDEDTRELLHCVLEDSGATVQLAPSVDIAVDTFKRSPAHAVISDIRLRNSDGYALIQAIRQHNADFHGFTAAIAVTGFASPDDRERALSAGFHAYVAKPFEPSELVRTLANLLGRPADQVA